MNLADEIGALLLENARGDIHKAFKEAVLLVAEIETERLAAEARTSSGFLRRDTSKLTWTRKEPIKPVDDGAWLDTGKVECS